MLIKYQIQFTYFPAVLVRILHKLPLSDLFSFVCNINYQQYDFEWNLFFCLKCYIAKSMCTQSVVEEYTKASHFFFFKIFFIKYQTFFF